MDTTTKGMLQRITEEFPPPKGKSHALYLHKDQLKLVIWTGGHQIVLEEHDLGRPLESLIADIRLYTARVFVGPQ